MQLVIQYDNYDLREMFAVQGDMPIAVVFFLAEQRAISRISHEALQQRYIDHRLSISRDMKRGRFVICRRTKDNKVVVAIYSDQHTVSHVD